MARQHLRCACFTRWPRARPPANTYTVAPPVSDDSKSPGGRLQELRPCGVKITLVPSNCWLLLRRQQMRKSVPIFCNHKTFKAAASVVKEYSVYASNALFMSKVNFGKGSGTFHRQNFVACTAQESDNVTTPHYPFRFVFYQVVANFFSI